jgi:hypothetical protein
MEELKQDFNKGKISQEKYEGLLKLYDTKLKNIDATLRIRKMQGLIEDEEDVFDHKKDDKTELEPKKNLADKHIVKLDIDEKPKSGMRYVVVAILFLIVAFIAGATSGFFNHSQQTNSQTLVNSLQINENAFPPTIESKTHNNTVQNNTVENYGYQYYSDDYDEENNDDGFKGDESDDFKPSDVHEGQPDSPPT